MRSAFTPVALSQYGMIQDRLDAACYETPEFLDVLSTCLTICRDRLSELTTEVSSPEYPEITPFLVYCHDQFEIGRKLREFEMCRVFGRVLGEAMCRRRNEAVHVAAQERRYGLNISFIVANCPRCGVSNRGIPASADGSTKRISTQPTHQSKMKGVGALCSGCLQWFVAEWD